MLDYLYWRGDLAMDSVPFNAVDGLILAWLASFPVDKVQAATVGKLCEALNGQSTTENGLHFLRLLSGSVRFSGMPILRIESRFSEPEEMQFAAMTVLTGDGYQFVAFRGTDATLIGWKEDFNMAFADEVPSQRAGVHYLMEAADANALPMRVGGHSKGGNLAVYAAVRCDAATKRRVRTVYNYDGPGLSESVMASPDYRAIEDRMETYLPQSSIVGILLMHAAEFYVVRSSEKGILQHDPYSWQVIPDGFETVEGLSRFSLYADKTLREWLGAMDTGERKRFVDAIYQIVSAGGAKTLADISDDWEQSRLDMLAAFDGLSFGDKLSLIGSIAELIRAAIGNL